MATIRAASDRITAQVTAFGQVKQSQYNEGSYQSVLFEGDGLPDGKIWRSMSPEQAQGFERGQQVFLVPTTNKKGQPSYDIELITPAAPQAPTTAPTAAIPDDQKRAIADYVTDLAALYSYCYQQASHQLAPHGAPEPAIQGAASTLFIAASRKFSL